MKILDKLWLGGGQVGIVKVQTEYDGVKYYCGLTQTSEEEDMHRIAKWGSTVDPSEIKRFFDE